MVLPVTNSELANKTNLNNAYHNADYGTKFQGVVDLGAGSDLFHFGGWGGGAAAGPLLGGHGRRKKLMATPTVMIFS